MKRIIVCVFLSQLVFGSLAQFSDTESCCGVRAQDVMWKKTLWRKFDLQSPSNASFFTERNKFSSFILKAIQKKAIPVFENDSLIRKLSLNEFNAKLLIPSCDEDLDQYYMGTDLSELEIKEEYIFDKHYSRLVICPAVITLYIPYNHPLNSYGYNYIVGAIRFSDLKAFEENVQQSMHWYNPYNEAVPFNFTAALLARKFDSQVIKITNPWNEYLDQYLNERDAFYSGLRIEDGIREFEYNLWVDHP